MKKILITENQIKIIETIFGDKKYVDALGDEYKQDIAGYDKSSHTRPKYYKEKTSNKNTTNIKLTEGGIIPEDNVKFWQNYFIRNPKHSLIGMFNKIMSDRVCSRKQARYLDLITGWDKDQENNIR